LTSHTALRVPRVTDGAAVHHLIARCPPLDTNSRYCSLLQCTHFARTSVLAEADGRVAGFVSGYREPDRPDTLFVWQVAVAPEARGRGLAALMIREILERETCRDVRFVETSITPDNAASWGTFRALARTLGATLTTRPWLSCVAHFESEHAAEVLVRIDLGDHA
jgi:L-2,4-diaminobutyric acid acetyltransferase